MLFAAEPYCFLRLPHAASTHFADAVPVLESAKRRYAARHRPDIERRVSHAVAGGILGDGRLCRRSALPPHRPRPRSGVVALLLELAAHAGRSEAAGTSVLVVDSIRHNRRTLESFDWVLVTSEEERLHALELVPGVRAEALPFILMDCEQFEPAPAPPGDPQMLFVGFLPHTPNSEALDYFIRKELPIIRGSEPRARLTVIEGASNAMKGLMHDNDVDYRGYVEAIWELYWEARVYIAPVTSGGGIRTKIVEAMAAGVPVVTNSFAPNGLGLLSDHHILIRDQPEESAAEILRLFRDDAHWRRIRDSARLLIENSYSLQRVGPRIQARYLQFLDEAA